jgi:hypothetical protein
MLEIACRIHEIVCGLVTGKRSTITSTVYTTVLNAPTLCPSASSVSGVSRPLEDPA